MTAEADRAARTLVETWLSHHPVPGARGGPGTGAAAGSAASAASAVTVRRVEQVRAGRPGLLSVVAEVDGRLVHLVAGLRSVGDEPHFLHAGDEGALGLYEDAQGLAVCTDALRDAQLAPLLLATLAGDEPRPGPVAVVRDDGEATVLDCGDRGDLCVFPWPRPERHPGVDLLVALEGAGFNHVAAPLVRWTWEGHDLGLVQEALPDRSGGWALALTSLRDHYALGGRPEAAGGDFGPEAHALGTMLARMHLALDAAFGRQATRVGDWVAEAEEVIGRADPALLEGPGVAELIADLRAVDTRLPAIRTHGDFHLGRTARTDQGWVVSDCLPGGAPVGEEAPVLRSPLADVADLLWSLHQASLEAALERDPAGRLDLAPLGKAWETRNRRAVLFGYLDTPGISGLAGHDRDVVRNLVAIFELVRSVRASR
jgi:hypothetical protein